MRRHLRVERIDQSKEVARVADAGIGYYELGVAREANVLVVLQLNAMGNPAGEGADDWVWTGETLQTALDRAVR